jgi:hypothetical protein
MATPTAASTPAAETLKDANAPFDPEVLEAVLALPVLVPVLPAPVFAEKVSVGVADVGGYDAPKALTSKGCETA